MEAHACYYCGKIITPKVLKKIGMCPKCGGRRVRGVSLNWWGKFLVKIHFI